MQARVLDLAENTGEQGGDAGDVWYMAARAALESGHAGGNRGLALATVGEPPVAGCTGMHALQHMS